MLQLFLQILLTSLVVIDPLGAVPLFISLTGDFTPQQKQKTIKTAIITSFIVLTLFILGGRIILNYLGIKPGSFYVAGGILFFMIALDMLFGQTKRTKTSKEEEQDVEQSEQEIEEAHKSVAVFPLAIPYISGPGMITTIMLYSADSQNFLLTTGMLFGAVILALVAMWAVLSASTIILKWLGKTGVSVIERIMGLLLSGLAVQFVFDGLTKLGVFAAH